jgi:hypothetical protein
LFIEILKVKRKKIANKILDYELGKKKVTGEKLKIKRSRIKHKIIMPEDSRRNTLSIFQYQPFILYKIKL